MKRCSASFIAKVLASDLPVHISSSLEHNLEPDKHYIRFDLFDRISLEVSDYRTTKKLIPIVRNLVALSSKIKVHVHKE